MAPRETGRREFLAGATGLGATGGSALDASVPGQSAVGVPGLDTDHAVRWTYEAGDEAVVYPCTPAHGLLFATIRRDAADAPEFEVVALDRQSGTVRWSQTLDGWSIPQARNGLVYVADREELLALDPRNGNVRWRFGREPYQFRNFVVDGGTVFLAGGARVAAIDATQGGTRWTTEISTDDRLRPPLPGDERVYLGGERGFSALDRADGRERWVAEVPPEETVTPAAVRDGLLVGWSDRAAYGIATTDGTREWRTDVEGLHPFGSIGTVTDDAAYVWGEELAAIDVTTGERRWTYDPDPGRGFDVRAAAGRLFVPVDTGAFVALDAETGREEWRFDAGERHGYWGDVADGRVYTVSTDQLHALGVESGRVTWSLDLGDERALWADVLGDLALVATREGTLHVVDRPSALATAPAATMERFATSPTGLGLLGLLGAGVLAAGYRWRGTRRADSDPDLQFGRLDRLGGGPVTETYRKRVRTPDGPRIVAETRLIGDAEFGTEVNAETSVHRGFDVNAETGVDAATEADAENGMNPEIRRAFEDAVAQWADLAESADRPRSADGILPLLDSGSDPTPWFETPFVAGGSLADAWPLARRERVEVASGVARALHAAHREGVAHGRLAPRHVFREETERGSGDDRVLVGGWFLADALADARDARDPYAPPESVGAGGDAVEAETDAGEAEAGEADANVDADTPGDAYRAGDVYRVGALAHHLLRGEVPEPADSGVASRASDDLSGVLARALAADPADRYDSLLGFDDDFRWAALDR